jgi:hypothetical protein
MLSNWFINATKIISWLNFKTKCWQNHSGKGKIPDQITTSAMFSLFPKCITAKCMNSLAGSNWDRRKKLFHHCLVKVEMNLQINHKVLHIQMERFCHQLAFRSEKYKIDLLS